MTEPCFESMTKAMNIIGKRNLFRARRSGVGLGLLLLSASCVPGAANLAERPAAPGDAAPVLASAAPPALPEPLALQPLAPDEAVAMNAAMPIAAIPNPAARPFVARGKSFLDGMRSLDCMTAAIYYEAASESDDGQRAVAQVVLNRVRHPSFPNSVCGVVYQGSERSTGCQFSFTCDGSLMRTPSASGWARARRIATAALAGSVFAPVGYSTHYHTYQVLPYWASSLVKSAVIGAHIFYRWNGGWGTPAAFRAVYAGAEPLPGPKPKETRLPLPLSPTVVQAELAAILRAETQVAAPVAPSALPPAPEPARKQAEAAESGPKLPESHVLEAYRYSGMPKDEVPASAVK